MTLPHEIAYYVLIALAIIAFGALLFVGKRELPRPVQVAAAVIVPTFLTAGLLDARWLSDRSTLLLSHYETPRTTQEVVDWFGKPDRIVAYPEGDFSWVYTVGAPPFRAEVVYAVFHNRIVGRTAGETVTTLETGKLRPVPAPVLREVADADPVNWVILPEKADPDDYRVTLFYGRWQPDKKDMPALIDAVYKYLWLYQVPNDDKADWPEEDRRDYHRFEQWSLNQVLINRPIYACQVVGYEKDGRKRIHLNFFPKNEITSRKPGTTEPWWHFRYVVVLDGGPSFWQIDYDCKAKTFLNFMPNGQG